MKNFFSYCGISRKLYQVILLSVFSILTLSSCSQDNLMENETPSSPELVYRKSAAGKTIGNITLQQNVIVLNDQSIASVSQINNQSLTFAYKTSQTDSIKVGTIIVGTRIKGDNIDNILAKIEAVSKSNNQIILQTSTPKLEEFIFSGTISGIYDPNGKAPVNINGKMVNYIPIEGMVSQNVLNKIHNIEAKNIAQHKSIILNPVNFDKTFSFDHQTGITNLTSSVSLKGGFTPKIKYNINFFESRLSDFHINFILDDISFKTKANIQGTLGYSKSPSNYLNIPIAPIAIGPTGLTLSPTFSASPFVWVQASGKAELTLIDIAGNANLLVGKDPEFNINLSPAGNMGLTQLEGNVNAELGIEAKGGAGLQFVAASIANSGLKGKISILPSLQLSQDSSKKVTIDINGKVETDMYYKFGVSPYVYEGSFSLLKKEVNLYNKNLAF
ncbi:hypothetical protein [Chryseobacterium potabilaquae]|uniref:Uncharacterized protein n=1 Tax=Chryseobacterium potabilaquae TaxID=2675057 RepID=A0A6N4X2F9_9FLAO|nr:hypothetical protein [Chryseobacterium potabilaquae]CAA7195073.1 hypothetical protein CHRY9293_01316 [Chryseobacterium potabilaquae]